jgi:hypothetical protein
MNMPSTTPFMSQTPTISLHEIADRLWAHGEHEAYRAVLAFIKERDAMLLHIKDLEKE